MVLFVFGLWILYFYVAVVAAVAFAEHRIAAEVSHALALHRGVIATPRGPTKLDTRENPFTQVDV